MRHSGSDASVVPGACRVLKEITKPIASIKKKLVKQNTVTYGNLHSIRGSQTQHTRGGLFGVAKMAWWLQGLR